ncbi:hypothetical protein LOTGIDRAFT_175386 [Lottia gigantea]|uniref:Peptidase A2 domain-containing protein n=1 Tax=Lottia gigantea TaxID=225164 RepID=V4AM22_LOTGI|nr:hypothetical protein LOTGIDRAFT_175386 [Lottia gigantea]ESO94646.1 hypothetical protein LOTGIDRAFT_175386 [Lottia gigantea]
MELDTGAAVTICSEREYRQYFPDAQLDETSVTLKTYTGQKIKPFVKMDVTVEVNDSEGETFRCQSYNRLIFGIASAPAIWQRSKEQVLQGIPMTECLLEDMIKSGRKHQ